MDNVTDFIIKTFHYRHACKQFDPTKVVSQENMRTILEAGRLSPSSFGLEPWKFLVVLNEDVKKKLYPIAWGARNSLDGASHLVIFLARRKIDTLHGSAYMKHMMYDVHHFPADVAELRMATIANFQEKDFKLTESDRAIFDWACKQTYIALGNMTTVAAMLSVDSCPIEGFNRDAVEELLTQEGLMDQTHFGVSAMAGFGYRAKEPRPKTRQSADEVIQWIK